MSNQFPTAVAHTGTLGISVWMSSVPLIHVAVIEWHPVDRVMRQFGRQQHLPQSPVCLDGLHQVDGRGRFEWDWERIHKRWIQLWNHRHRRIVEGPFDNHDGLPSSTYLAWYWAASGIENRVYPVEADFIPTPPAPELELPEPVTEKPKMDHDPDVPQPQVRRGTAGRGRGRRGGERQSPETNVRRQSSTFQAMGSRLPDVGSSNPMQHEAGPSQNPARGFGQFASSHRAFQAPHPFGFMNAEDVYRPHFEESDPYFSAGAEFGHRSWHEPDAFRSPMFSPPRGLFPTYGDPTVPSCISPQPSLPLDYASSWSQQTLDLNESPAVGEGGIGMLAGTPQSAMGRNARPIRPRVHCGLAGCRDRSHDHADRDQDR